MTKKTWKSKPPHYQPSDPSPPPPYTYTPEETTPLLSENPSYPSSFYASSSSSPSFSTPSSTYAPSTTDSGSSSLPSDFPRRNRTLRRAFRELRRDYLIATYHRALDVVSARGWRPTLRWPGSAPPSNSPSQSAGPRDEDGEEEALVEGDRGKRGKVRRSLCGRVCGRVRDRKRRRRRVILCCNLLFWILVALFIAVGVRKWGYFGGRVQLPGRKETVRVGIVGAGPAGVSAAHTLSTSFRSKNVNLEIVLFEQKAQIGGRMVLNPSFPKEHLGRKIHAEDVASGELGSTVLRERARNMLDVELGHKGESRGKEVGFFNGQSLVAKLTRPLGELSWGAWLGLVWKYKFSFLNAKELPKGTMKNFERLLTSRGTFGSVNDMAKAAGIEGAIGLGAVTRLSTNHVGGQYVPEVLYPQVLRQTGQDVTELSDLAISMALEREDQVSRGDVGSFETVLERFVKQSGAELRLGTKVTGLKRELVDKGKEAWVLELRNSGHHPLEYEVFDHIILAGPSSLLPKQKHLEDKVYYRPLWVTFLLSTNELNKEYFGSSEDMPPQVLPIQSENIPSELQGVHEISYVGDVFGPGLAAESVRKLYRILSDRSLWKEKILAFGEGAVLELWEENIEHAYPLMWPRNGKFGDFKVEDGLWHTGTVEAIGSSVDLSWVAGDNVARLVAREVGRRRA